MPESSKDSESTSNVGPGRQLRIDQAYIARLKELELELSRTRSEATAARLEARAAELELRIRRLGGRGESEQQHASDSISMADADPPRRTDSVQRGSVGTNDVLPVYTPALPRDRMPREATVFRRLAPAHSDSIFRVDTAADAQGHSGVVTESPSDLQDAPESGDPLATGFQSWDQLRQTIYDLAEPPIESELDTPDVPRVRVDKSHCRPRLVEAAQVSGIQPLADNGDGKPAQGNRKRSRAWITSALVHGGLILLLALVTFSHEPPGDQIAISGSVTDLNEVNLESLSIETETLPASETEPAPVEVEPVISDLGQITVSEVSIDQPTRPNTSIYESMFRRDAVSAAAMSLKSDSESMMEFCGVQGGGNHFVYLVDSSGSMGEAFDSARTELLRSIDLLKPDQRFYVVFFDAEPDYMRLQSPDQDERRSVYATPENKQALRRWAMSIKMDRGRAPYEAIPFAIDLRPDVVFLLSDGEFPQSIEDLLNQVNRVDNLFDDDRPISIIHTIGYYSRSGETRMRRIAQQHGGMYRHVPKPK